MVEQDVPIKVSPGTSTVWMPIRPTSWSGSWRYCTRRAAALQRL